MDRPKISISLIPTIAFFQGRPGVEMAAASKRDLVGEWPKMSRAGQTDVSDLLVAVNALMPVSKPLYAVACHRWVSGWWVRLPLPATSCRRALRRFLRRFLRHPPKANPDGDDGAIGLEPRRAGWAMGHLKVKVVPGSSRNQIVGWLGDALKIKVSAPPEKGRANEAVVVLLAENCGLTDCGTSLPEQDALAVDPGNPRRFLRSTKWKKAMDGFFHGQPSTDDIKIDSGHSSPSKVVAIQGTDSEAIKKALS